MKFIDQMNWNSETFLLGTKTGFVIVLLVYFYPAMSWVTKTATVDHCGHKKFKTFPKKYWQKWSDQTIK